MREVSEQVCYVTRMCRPTGCSGGHERREADDSGDESGGEVHDESE